jgi:PTS system beta-glucosides-specific IIC component
LDYISQIFGKSIAFIENFMLYFNWEKEGCVLFGRSKRKNNNDEKNDETRIAILAPLEGEAIPVTQVDDPTFSEEMLGRGVAIRPAAGKVVSPVSGTVTQMFDTSHAVSLTSDDGVEILIHVGLNTVKLKGSHFTVHAKDGDKIKPGDLLLEFDLTAIAGAGYDTVTPVVICNSDDFGGFEANTGKNVMEGDDIIYLTRK